MSTPAILAAMAAFLLAPVALWYAVEIVLVLGALAILLAFVAIAAVALPFYLAVEWAQNRFGSRLPTR